MEKNIGKRIFGIFGLQVVFTIVAFVPIANAQPIDSLIAESLRNNPHLKSPRPNPESGDDCL